MSSTNSGTIVCESSASSESTVNEQIVNIRALAILLVVIGHSIILYSQDWNLYLPTKPYQPFNIAKVVINTIQMPLFFSVSGYLFQYTLTHKNITFVHFFTKKTQRLLIPFIFVSFCWMLPLRLLVGYPGYLHKPLAVIVFKEILWGDDVGHLWFLPSLFLIFLGMWTIRKLLIRKNRLLWFLLFAMVIVGHFITINVYLKQACTNAFWFFIGYMIFQQRGSYGWYTRIANHRYILMTSMVLAQIINICIELDILPAWSGFKFVLETITSLFTIITAYVFTTHKKSKFLQILSRNSFGIYLFHSPLVYITYAFWSSLNPWLVFAINFICFGSFALLLTIVLRKAPFKMFIGEKA